MTPFKYKSTDACETNLLPENNNNNNNHNKIMVIYLRRERVGGESGGWGGYVNIKKTSEATS